MGDSRSRHTHADAAQNSETIAKKESTASL